MTPGEWSAFVLAVALLGAAFWVGQALADVYERIVRRRLNDRDAAYRRHLDGGWWR